MGKVVKLLVGLALTTILWQSQTCDALRLQFGNNGLRPLQSDVWHFGPHFYDQLWNWNGWDGQWKDPFASHFFDDIFQTPRWYHSLLPERQQHGRCEANCQQGVTDKVNSEYRQQGLKTSNKNHRLDRSTSCQQARDEEIRKEQHQVECKRQSEIGRQQELERLQTENAERYEELVHEREELLRRQNQIEEELRQREELKHQKELQIEQQRQEIRRQEEAQRQQQIQLQKQEMERQKERELKEKRQRELELERMRQREREFQKQRQRELELQQQRQRELELQQQKQREIELQRQREIELQRQKQEEERIRQSERLKRETVSSGPQRTGSRNQHPSGHNGQHFNHQHNQNHHKVHANHRNSKQMGQRVEIVSLNVKDYDPEDFTISTNGGNLLLEGRHVCRCDESCFERELERKVKLSQGVDTRSLSANYDKDGILTIEGVKYRHDVPLEDVQIPVKGVRLHRQIPPCKHLKSGIKLKKMNKVTGQIMDDIPTINSRTPVFENELDGDGVTIETEEYHHQYDNYM